MAKEVRQFTKQNGDGKVFNFRPVTFCFLFLALGVVLGYFVSVEGSSPWFGLPILLLAFGVAAASLRRSRWLRAMAILCLCFVVGGLSFCGVVANFQKVNTYDGTYACTGVVHGKSRFEGGYYLTIDDLTIDGKQEKGRMIAYLPAASGEEIRLGGEIVFMGQVTTDTSLKDDYGLRASAIVHREYYRVKGVTDLVVVGSVSNLFLFVRQRIYDVLSEGLDEQSSAFAAGLLLGDDSGIESGLLSNIRRGGIAHIFAVSGLHIGVLFALCLWLTKGKFFRERRKIFSWLFTAAVLIFYGGVCGFSPSIFRAVCTCLLAYGYKLCGAKRDNLESVSFAAGLLILLSPAYLFDVGYLLSFGACYGVLLFAPPISAAIQISLVSLCDFWRYKILKKQKVAEDKSIFDGDTPPDSIAKRAGDKALSVLSVTLSAWLGTLAISLGFFRSISLWGMLFNFLFVPFLSAFYVLLLALVVLCCILPTAASAMVLFMPNAVLGGVILIFELIPLGEAVVPFSVVGTICLYLGLLSLTDKFNLAKKTKAVLAVVAILSALCCFILPLFL